MITQAAKYVWMCKGCRSDGMCCFQMYKQSFIEICPCRVCLVKGICLHPCKPYEKEAHLLFHKCDLPTMEGKKIF